MRGRQTTNNIPPGVSHLLQRDEAGRHGRANTWTTVSNRVVGDGELSEVVSNHIGLDLDDVEDLSVVDGGSGANHLWKNKHITDVGLDWLWLLAHLRLLKLVQQGVVLALQATLHSPTKTSMENLDKLLLGHLQKLL